MGHLMTRFVNVHCAVSHVLAQVMKEWLTGGVLGAHLVAAKCMLWVPEIQNIWKRLWVFFLPILLDLEFTAHRNSLSPTWYFPFWFCYR